MNLGAIHTRRPFIGTRTGFVLACIVLLDTAVRAQLPTYVASGFDTERVAADDTARAQRGDLELYGRLQEVDLDTERDGLWSEEADHVWRARVISPGALATELFFADVRLPEGASFSILNDAGRITFGPFTAADLQGTDLFTTPLVDGEASIVEYREPIGVEVRGGLRITHVGHAYRDVMDGPCHVNVACSPEGDGWREVAAAVVRISVVVPAGMGWCSGTLVNNVRQDCTPYVLTAWHCGAASTTANFNQYKFYFNFAFSGCSGGAYSTAQFRTGAQLKAFSNDNSGNSGSDFMLLQLNAAIPDSFDPYYAGWDATLTSTSSADGVCLHHPTSAPKKVSTYTQTLTTGHWASASGLQSHWRVYWAPTENGHGITEDGSSGGPLLKQDASGNAMVIGTLSGSVGGLSCDNPGTATYFGKMSYHWAGNPNTATQKLKNWLDPDNTGATQLLGNADPCGLPSSVHTAGQDMFQISPNPASNRIAIVLKDRSVGSYTTVLVCDATGRVEHQLPLDPSGRSTIDISQWTSGVHFLRLIGNKGTVMTAPLVKTP